MAITSAEIANKEFLVGLRGYDKDEVRAFLADEVARGTFDPSLGQKNPSYDREFSRRAGAQGWIGMTWPREYGGGGRPDIDRLIVGEELIAAGAPMVRLTGISKSYGTVQAVKRLARDDVFCLLLGSTGTPTPFEKELERAIEAAEAYFRAEYRIHEWPVGYDFRMGQVQAARSTLARMKELCRRMPEAVFAGEPAGMSKDEWRSRIEQMASVSGL